MDMFWPGLAAAWHNGQPKGLLTSILFGWLLCWLLLASFVWPDLVSQLWTILGWIAAGLLSGYCFLRRLFHTPNYLVWDSEESSKLFSEAQQDYLRGKWFEAEAKLLRLCEQTPSDIPSGLLLVGVLRHTGRVKAALRRIDQLNLLDSASGWQFELRQEKKLLEDSLADSTASPQ